MRRLVQFVAVSATLALPVLAVPSAGAATMLTRVDVSAGTAQTATSASYPDAISRTGRFIAFHSTASGLVAGASHQQAYLWDATTRGVRLASSLADGTPAAAGTTTARGVSDDGRYVLIESDAANLPGADGQTAVYRKDMTSGALTRIADGRAAAPHGFSADGRYALVTQRTASGWQARAYDLTAHTSTVVLPDATLATSLMLTRSGAVVYTRPTAHGETFFRCAPGSGTAQQLFSVPSFQDVGASFDGSRIAFTTTARLVSADTDTRADVYERDAQTGTFRRVTAKIGHVALAGLSDDGQAVLYTTPDPAEIGWRQGYLYSLADGSTTHTTTDAQGAALHHVDGGMLLAGDGVQTAIDRQAQSADGAYSYHVYRTAG